MSGKRFGRVTAVALTLAIGLTLVFMFHPEAVGTSANGLAMAYADAVFGQDQVMTVDITVSEDVWQGLLDNAQAEEYVPCDITINGTTCYQVGIRCKGNSSLRMADGSQRYSFKVNFDEYVKGQTMLGLDKMVFNNTQGDATWMKEYLSYYTMDMVGVNVPLYSLAKIYVNGKLWGLYLGLEALEQSYALRNYGTDYGHLYKVESMDMDGGFGGGDRMNFAPPEGFEMPENFTFPEGGAFPDALTMPDFFAMPSGEPQPDGAAQATEGAPALTDSQGNGETAAQPIDRNNRGLRHMEGGFAMFSGGNGADLIYIDDDPDSYSAIFSKTVLGSTKKSDKERVVAALKGIDDKTADIANYVDVDQMLRYIAGNAAVGNGDGYFGSMMHNYYVYEKNGKITMLPWDYNLSYGGFMGSADSLINLSIDEPFTSGSLADRPIMAKLLENEEYKETYYEYIRQIGDFYANGEAAALINSLNEMIREWVDLDPTKAYTLAQYDAAVSMLKEYIALRGESMQGQLDGNAPKLDTSAINVSTMGNQGGMGGGGNWEDRGGQAREAMMNQGWPANPAQGDVPQQDGVQPLENQPQPAAALNQQEQNAARAPGGMQGFVRPGEAVEEAGVKAETVWLLALSAGAMIAAIVCAVIFRRRRFTS